MGIFLKKQGAFLMAFLFAFLLIGTPVTAQEDDSFLIETQNTDDGWEWDTSWDEDDLWGDDWDYTYDTTTTGDLSGAEAAAALGIVFGIWGIVMLPIYIYFALTLMVTAKKLEQKNAWFAWVPILNIILMLQCAGLSPWLFLLTFVPLANIIVLIFAYMKIAERRGFESWLGILMIVPIAQLIIPGYLAWGEPVKKA